MAPMRDDSGRSCFSGRGVEKHNDRQRQASRQEQGGGKGRCRRRPDAYRRATADSTSRRQVRGLGRRRLAHV
eukprot:scaffold5627_cov158-Amphora_coffeaeformis.AAC.4